MPLDPRSPLCTQPQPLVARLFSVVIGILPVLPGTRRWREEVRRVGQSKAANGRARGLLTGGLENGS